MFPEIHFYSSSATCCYPEQLWRAYLPFSWSYMCSSSYIHLNMFCLNVAFMIFYRLRLRGKRLCFVRFLVYKINTYSCSFIWSCLGHTKHWPVVTWTRRSWTIVSLNHVRDPLDSSAATLKRSACAHVSTKWSLVDRVRDPFDIDWSRPYNVGSAQVSYQTRLG